MSEIREQIKEKLTDLAWVVQENLDVDVRVDRRSLGQCFCGLLDDLPDSMTVAELRAALKDKAQ